MKCLGLAPPPDKIAKEADFFSFGTNDLTQTTFGFSRDDTGTFFESYFQEKILPIDPFEQIDQDGRWATNENCG